MKFLFAFVAAAALIAAEEIPNRVRILPVKRTPEAEGSSVVVVMPKDGSVVRGNPVWLQVRVEGYPIGAASQFDRADEVAVSKQGQTIHIVVDNMPYFAVNEPALDPFNEEGWYYETNYKFEVPAQLSEGEHTLRVFLARSFGESLKGEMTFKATTFYVGNGDKSPYDLSRPYITYNEPSNQLYLVEKTPVLLDFLINNCELSADGYKVRLTVDGKASRLLTSWQPYYIYGLAAGKHTIRLELLNSSGVKVKGPFSDIQQTITVHKD